MNKDLTELVFILDRSGSMAARVDDVLGGFNTLIEKQRKEPGAATVTTWLFDTEHDCVYEGTAIGEVGPLTNAIYYARGSTALNDAIGRCFATVGARLKRTPEEKRPGKVIVTIMTDGLENASTEYTREAVAKLIEHQRSKYNWEVIYVGANQDAQQVAAAYKIPARSSMTYAMSTRGMAGSFDAINSSVSSSRGAGGMSVNFSDQDRKAAVETDDKNNA